MRNCDVRSGCLSPFLADASALYTWPREESREVFAQFPCDIFRRVENLAFIKEVSESPDIIHVLTLKAVS
jgi:hypothetical protein